MKRNFLNYKNDENQILEKNQLDEDKIEKKADNLSSEDFELTSEDIKKINNLKKD